MSQAKSTQKAIVDDIWTIIEKEPITAAVETTLNSSLVFAGDFSSGKTTLINSFLKPKDSKETKPTIALDYNFARKVVGNVKTVANFWEIGGDLIEPKLIEIGITKDNLGTSFGIIVCDLSKPHNILQSVQRSVGAFKEIISKRASELQATNVNELTEIRNKVTAMYKSHVDSKRVRPTEVPLFIIANKYDTTRTLSSADRRSVAQILRFAAHYYGATLMYVSSSDAPTRENFRSLMNSLSFDQPIKGGYEINPDKPLYVCKGLDSFQNILTGGMTFADSGDSKTPKNRLLSSEGDIDYFLSPKGITKDSWKRLAAHLSSLFGEPDPLPLSNSASSKDTAFESSSGLDAKRVVEEDDPANYPEKEVDDMREVRKESLRRYIAEEERKNEMITKMNARGSGGSAEA